MQEPARSSLRARSHAARRSRRYRGRARPRHGDGFRRREGARGRASRRQVGSRVPGLRARRGRALVPRADGRPQDRRARPDSDRREPCRDRVRHPRARVRRALRREPAPRARAPVRNAELLGRRRAGAVALTVGGGAVGRWLVDFVDWSIRRRAELLAW
ncbi:hypothetical protein BVI2075_160085 [Burkholderia vietnamiensis]|nr:hypothetical protein BVI2075_160085 [Burkholderia vietnamiensis]